MFVLIRVLAIGGERSYRAYDVCSELLHQSVLDTLHLIFVRQDIMITDSLQLLGRGPAGNQSHGLAAVDVLFVIPCTGSWCRQGQVLRRLGRSSAPGSLACRCCMPL